jgi:hypothetical protein
MSAYVIFIRESTIDRSELDAYAKAVGPILEGLPIKCLAANGRQLVLEGPASRQTRTHDPCTSAFAPIKGPTSNVSSALRMPATKPSVCWAPRSVR